MAKYTGYFTYKGYSTILFVAFLIILSALSLILGSMKGCGCKENRKEGFDTVPLRTDPVTKKIVSGYYQVDSQNMAVIPYGYAIDPNDPTKIVPKTATEIGKLSPDAEGLSVPPEGQTLPEGYYKLNDASLAILPPNMLPAVKSIDFTDDTPPRLLVYYTNGYVSSAQYYASTYTPLRQPSSLPAGVYYTSMSKTQMAFLPYGKIADSSNGYGMIDDPKLKTTASKFDYQQKQYRDISNNYDVQFHDDLQDLRAQHDASDLSFGQVRVKDQKGNIVILPSVPAQDKVTYYQPGEFPFGSSKYVPNYEDSIYLSTITRQSVVSPYATGTKPVEACKAYKDLKAQMERYCS